MVIESSGDFYIDNKPQIAAPTATLGRKPATPHRKHIARLGSCWHRDLDIFAIDAGNGQCATEGRLSDRNDDFGHEVATIAFVQCMTRDANFDIQITRGCPMPARFTSTGDP